MEGSESVLREGQTNQPTDRSSSQPPPPPPPKSFDYQSHLVILIIAVLVFIDLIGMEGSESVLPEGQTNQPTDRSSSQPPPPPPQKSLDYQYHLIILIIAIFVVIDLIGMEGSESVLREGQTNQPTDRSSSQPPPPPPPKSFDYQSHLVILIIAVLLFIDLIGMEGSESILREGQTNQPTDRCSDQVGSSAVPGGQ